MYDLHSQIGKIHSEYGYLFGHEKIPSNNILEPKTIQDVCVQNKTEFANLEITNEHSSHNKISFHTHVLYLVLQQKQIPTQQNQQVCLNTSV